MAFNISNLLANKSNNTVLILVSITIVIFTILVSWYLISSLYQMDLHSSWSRQWERLEYMVPLAK